MALTSCTNNSSELGDTSSGISSAEELSVNAPTDENDISSDFSDIIEESSGDTSGEEPVLQTEMTDEMWEIWFKEYGRSDEYNYSYKTIGMLNDYLYLKIWRARKDGVATPLGNCYPADGYLFLGYQCGKSEIGCYLFADKKFITFEEVYEAGLFEAADAYALLEELYGDDIGLVVGIEEPTI